MYMSFSPSTHPMIVHTAARPDGEYLGPVASGPEELPCSQFLVAAGFWSIPTPTRINTELSGGSEEPATPPRPPPPLYEEYHERETNLPQYNMALPYPEGSHAKFL
ncbi:hypothetical protein B0H11DRAFT_16379 [Mycena galericulata]|nr:hypothetical protein B0H11DRAFT_16379 [Mycena galericulata]